MISRFSRSRAVDNGFGYQGVNGGTARRRRILLERLHARELLAADLGLEPQPTTTAEPASAVIAEEVIAEDVIADDVIELAKSLRVFGAEGTQPGVDHWLLSWGEEVEPAVTYGPSVIESFVAAPLLDEAYVVRFQQAFDVFEVVQHLNRPSGLEMAYPLVEKDLELRSIPNDFLFDQQWHLLNDGSIPLTTPGEDINVTPVWEDYRGAGVVIGFIDEGIEAEHEDLVDNYRDDLSFDYNFNSEIVFPATYHGTGVAGLASGVQNNSIGVSGVAPESEIADIKLFGVNFPGANDLVVAQTLNHELASVDIYNKSLGPRSNRRLDPGSQPGPLSLAALENAITNGREGLGSVITMAAGNGGEFDNVNLDGYANSRHTIAVSAVDANGLLPEYAEPGAPILITAPSSNGTTGLLTTDLENVYGLSTTNYTNEFGNSSIEGTSGSTAIVSGVIALMLEANPDLTHRDVQHILVQSARLNDVENPDWVENGAGRMFHPFYGFGVVDAEAAVALAETWSSKGPEVQWDSGVVTLDQTLDTQESATFNVKAPVNFQIEHLQLELESLHQLPGEMEIFVTSPAGTTTQLVSPYFGGADITFDHPLTSTDLWDEWAFGDWTIEVVNGFGELELSEMRLTLFGNVIQDAVPELRITDVAVPEDRESMNFLVSIDEPYSEDITFTVYTMEDTAVTTDPDPDYVPQQGVEYTIEAGEVAVVVPIELVDNLAEEEDETFWLALSEPVSGRVPFDAVVGTILNEDFPRVIDAAPWDEIGVQGSHAAKSTANEVEVDLGNDVAFLQFDGFAGTKLSLRATPDNPDATVNLQLLDAEDNVIAGPLSSPAPGEPVRVDHLELPGDGLYRWETTTDDLTTVAFEMYANTVIEGWDGDDGATTELTLDPSVFGDLPSRYGVLGTIDAQSIIPELTEGNAGDVFVDISETGTPLNLTDDGVAQVETTIGNRMLPAGPIRISNNGLVLAGSSGIPGYVNEQLPFENLGTLVAPYWDDLTDVSGNVYWEEIDFNGVPTLVVQWDDLSHFNSPTTGGVTFQLHIYQEGSGGPLARYIYNDVSFGVAGLDGGASATVGFQVAESDEANQYSFNTPESIADSDVITWSTAPDVDTFPIDLTGAVGEDIDVILAPLEGTPTNNLSVAVFGPPSDELLAAGTTTPDEIDVTNYAIGIPTFTVANSGTHTVRVEGMGLGDYLLLVTRGGAFDTEPNNDQEEALRKISDSTGAVGFLEDPDAPGAQGTDEVDFYELALTADDRVVLETSVPYAVEGVSHPDSLDPMLELYDPKGALLASDGDAVGDGRNARIRFIAPFDGLYRLGVSAEAGVGRYLVRSTPWVNNVPEEVELTNNELAENTSTDAGPVAVGLLTTIDADPLDTHQYELVSGFGDDDNGAFTIVDDQLFINQGVELDYETKNRFAIRVRSTDDYGDSVESRLNVFVLDRGEVELVTVGTGAQRSRVNQLTVLFDSTVAVNPGAFAVSKRGPEGGVVEVEYTTDTDEFNRTVATITFGGAFFQNDSLVDGNYELRINALRVRDATGNPIDGNRDGFAGGDYLFGETEADGFFRHFGDVDGDREVDFSDFLGFRGAYGTASGEAGYLDAFDVDDDEVIGFADFLEFRNRYGSRLDFE